MVIFFFSSRRRHTRSLCDWSSDVCSSDLQEKVAGLARSNLLHQGAELAYLLRHDPEFRSVRRDHLVEAGRRVRLKDDIELFTKLLDRDWDGVRFQFCVISAAPREVVRSALGGIVPPENIFG